MQKWLRLVFVGTNGIHSHPPTYKIHDPGNDRHNGLDQGYSGGSVGLRHNA